MWVEFGIGMSVMEPVHDGIGLRAHIRRALCDVCYNEEEALPAFAHGECAMCGIAVLKKGLGKL